MRLTTLLFLAVAMALLAACASTPDPQYQAYVQLVQEQEAQRQARFASIASAADKCTGDACVQMVAAIAALAQAGGGGQGNAPEQYRRQPGSFERFGLAAIGTLAPLAQAFAAIDAGRNGVDIARIGAEREIAITQAWSQTTTGVAGAFAGLPPSISVGGDYITGRQHIGDAVGRDQIGGDQHIGDAIGRDVIGGDRIDNRGNIGSDNRIASPGPFDVGDRCSGDDCQSTQPPPPPPVEPDPEG